MDENDVFSATTTPGSSEPIAAELMRVRPSLLTATVRWERAEPEFVRLERKPRAVEIAPDPDRLGFVVSYLGRGDRRIAAHAPTLEEAGAGAAWWLGVATSADPVPASMPLAAAETETFERDERE